MTAEGDSRGVEGLLGLRSSSAPQTPVPLDDAKASTLAGHAKAKTNAEATTSACAGHQPPNYPPSFNTIGSFVHGADYAAGLVLRSSVLLPLLSDLAAGVHDPAEGDTDEEEKESSALRVLEDFVSGNRLYVEKISNEDRSSFSDGSGRQGISESANRKVQKCRVLPASSWDAPTVASWYNSAGDAVLSHTSRAWSDWWVERCGNNDVGCEMIKLVTSFEEREEEEEERSEGGGHAVPNKKEPLKAKELVLALAYVERNVLDCHPVLSQQKEEEKEGEPTSTHKKQKRSLSCDPLPENVQQSRNIRTTLLRGIRINPTFNPRVRARLNKKSGAQPSADMNVPQSLYGIPALLTTYVIAQSFLYGTEAAAINCTKDEHAETFYESILGNEVEGRDDDGRRYYRLRGGDRFEVLRLAIARQIALENDSSSK